MTNNSGRTRQSANDLRDELIWDKLRKLTKVAVSLRQQNDIAVTDFFNKKKCCNHRCSDSVYLNTLLLIISLNAIETLICRREMS